MFVTWLHVLIDSVALFLLGTNISLLFNLRTRLVRWFMFKIIAVMLLLVYITLSTTFGDPSAMRMSTALAALAVDGLAVYYMWTEIERGRKRGVVGLVPILRDPTSR